MPIEKLKTIREQVYSIIKDSICTGEIQPGQRLQEKELSEKLNVSRSPIREALRLLAADGIVVDIPNKGVFVKKLTITDIEEIFEMRILLESYAISKLKDNISSLQKESLNEIINAMEQYFTNKDVTKYSIYDNLLHNEIIKICGNSLLEKTYSQIGTMINQFRMYSLHEPTRFNDSFNEHKQLINYLLSSDTENAILVNTKHLEYAKKSIIKYIKNV